MFKKLIAGALASLVLATSAMVMSDKVFAAGGQINASKYPNKYYHQCAPGTCTHYYEGTYLGLDAENSWGFVYSTKNDHRDSLKYISITTYTYNGSNETYTEGPTVNKKSDAETVISPNAVIDGSVAKVVYNGQIYHTSQQSSGVLKKYLIGSFRSGCKIK